MNRGDYPITTIGPSALSAMDLTNYFRPRQWDDRPDSIKMRKEENDFALIAFLDRLPLAEKTLTNPMISWRVDTRVSRRSRQVFILSIRNV